MKKKRKSLWIVFVCLLVIIYLAGYYLLWMRTNPISYYVEKAKGNYNVSRVLHNARTGDARMLAMLGDKTYYYDYSDNKLRNVDPKSGKLQSALPTREAQMHSVRAGRYSQIPDLRREACFPGHRFTFPPRSVWSAVWD